MMILISYSQEYIKSMDGFNCSNQTSACLLEEEEEDITFT